MNLGGFSIGLGRQLPCLLQGEAAECGLACLAMIASYHGNRIDVSTVRTRYGLSQKGATLATLLKIAGRMDLAGRPLRLELHELKDLAAPCILHWDMNHFVVLRRVKNGRIWIHDPAIGARTLSLAEVSAHFTGVALELTPTRQFASRDERRRLRLRDVMGPVSGLARALGHALVLSFGIQLLMLAAPLLAQLTVDHVIVSADRTLLSVLIGAFGTLLLVQVGVMLVRSWTLMMMSASIGLQWSSNVLTHLLRLPMSFFERRHSGDIVSRFSSTGVIQRTLTSTAVEAVLDGAFALILLALMAGYSPLLAGISLSAVALYLALRLATFGALRDANHEQLILGARQQTHLLETLRGIQGIKLFGREEERRSRWLGLAVEATNRGLAAQRHNAIYGAANTLFFGTQHLAIIWVGAELVMSGTFSVGMLVAFLAYKEQFSSRVASLVDRAAEIRMLGLHAERISDIVTCHPEPAGAPAASERADSAAGARIELRGVSFRYAESEPLVLDGISLTIESGEAVALVGASGGGKTTLAKLLLGVYAPSAGDILVDGTPLRSAGPQALRSIAGTVMQDDALFTGSIADNISFFDPARDMDRIRQCARAASIHADIAAMPMGYETLVGDMGGALSGGQRQRIMLARALYHRPRILILDEATSHLDVDHERLVSAAIRDLRISRLVIAHRPETIRTCDRVVSLHGGKLHDHGALAHDRKRVAEAIG